jgi:outer membrane lipoprotein
MRIVFAFMALIVALSLELTGCATQVISRDSQLLVDRSIPFAVVRREPERFLGKYLILAGVIARVSNAPTGAELEVVQLPVDSDDRPAQKGRSEGRFLAQTGRFLDPLIYKQGRLVTLVGKVAGSAVRPLEGVEYSYPVLEMRELYLWRPDDPYASPTVHFGIGVGVDF